MMPTADERLAATDTKDEGSYIFILELHLAIGLRGADMEFLEDLDVGVLPERSKNGSALR